MYPDPHGSLPERGAAPPAEPSAALAVLGLVWAGAFLCLFFLFDALEGIAGGRNTAPWGYLMWGIFGPQVIMGLSVFMGGRGLPRPVRALFVLATLASLAAGLVAAGQIKGGPDHIAFMAISVVIAMIPQSIGWLHR